MAALKQSLLTPRWQDGWRSIGASFTCKDLDEPTDQLDSYGQRQACAAWASVRMAQAWPDPAQAQASQLVPGTIISVLPAATRAVALSMAVHSPFSAMAQPGKAALHLLRPLGMGERFVEGN